MLVVFDLTDAAPTVATAVDRIMRTGA